MDSYYAPWKHPHTHRGCKRHTSKDVGNTHTPTGGAGDTPPNKEVCNTHHMRHGDNAPHSGRHRQCTALANIIKKQ